MSGGYTVGLFQDVNNLYNGGVFPNASYGVLIDTANTGIGFQSPLTSKLDNFDPIGLAASPRDAYGVSAGGVSGLVDPNNTNLTPAQAIHNIFAWREPRHFAQ